MSNDLWRWADPDGQQRRVRLDELRAALAGGHIAPNTPVWRSGWRGWQSAHEVPELQSSALSAANGVVPNIPPPPLAMVAVQHEFEAQAGGTFSQPPPEPSGPADDEPPPPPAYVPVAVRANSIPPAAPSSGRLSRRPSAAASSGGTPAVPPVAAVLSVSPIPVTIPRGMVIASSMPTTVGLPPPPEMLAMVEAHRAATATAAAPATSGMIEELSGSMLLDDAALPAPTDPVQRGAENRPSDYGSGDPAGFLPQRRPQLTAIFDDLEAIKAGRSPKNKLLLGVVAFIGFMIVLSLLAVVVSAVRGKPSDLPADTRATSASASSAPSFTAPSVDVTPPAPPAEVAAPKEDPKPAQSSLGDCAPSGEAHVVSRQAFLQSGVEAVVVPGGIALGFGIDPRNGLAVTVDPASVGITTAVKNRAFGADARRVTPLLEKGKLTVVPDNDKRGDRLQVRRVVATTPAIDVGVAEGSIVWAPHGLNTYAKLFALEGEGAVEALRAVPLAGAKGIALTFRRGNAIFVGVAKGDAALTAEGALSRIAGLGQVGSPALTTSGDAIVVAWSDRATGQDPWQVRWSRFGSGAAVDAAKALALPEGGLGVQAMSPSLAGLGGGRFVIAWSEGTPSHQVRAQTFGADGSPSGAAFVVSATGINAGQPGIALGPDGRGVVAFLAAKGKAYEVQATPVSCAAK